MKYPKYLREAIRMAFNVGMKQILESGRPHANRMGQDRACNIAITSWALVEHTLSYNTQKRWAALSDQEREELAREALPSVKYSWIPIPEELDK